ncbi:hypothetical protein ACFYUV_04090 [Nonomuraea sp. NPDC003560]|uniref:hypothetical protein n=1 Tax=Nonomuraea sp. NPDC003560 TaxID=3364341 RepID=UPI0036AF06B2
MTQSHINTPTEDDIIRSCIELLRARHNEEQVRQLIDSELAPYSTGLHASILKVVLRVIVAQFYAPAARRLDHEIGWEFCDAGLDLQAAATNGELESSDNDEGRPHLFVIGS